MIKGRVRNHLKNRQPSEVEILQALAQVEDRIHLDEPFVLAWGKSARGVPRLRIEGSSHDVRFLIDLYAGGYSYSNINNLNEVFGNPTAAINFVIAQVEVQRNARRNSYR